MHIARGISRFLEISRRSLNEVKDCLRSAQLKGYVTDAELESLNQWIRRLFPAIGNLIAYLRRNPRRNS